jgi:hypothetical protein
MATAQTTTTKTPAEKKPAKPPVPVFTRLSEQMNRGTLGGKITAEELDKLAALANSLKVFLSA